jgi:putative transcriptional regulator
MAKEKCMSDERFQLLLSSAKEAVAIAKGEKKAARRTIITSPDASVIREKLELSRREFASLLGVSERTLEGWEQKRRTPTGPARALLLVAERQPKALLEALHK